MNDQPDTDDLFPGSRGESPRPDDLTPTLIEGELRIRDIDLAQRLGFSKPAKIRELIARHIGALTALGELPTVGTTHASNGRTFESYYLNRKQAIFVIAKSETPEATDVTIEIIERFDAYERGFRGPIPGQPSLTSEDRSAVGGIMKRVAANQIKPLFQMLEMLKQEVAAIKAAPPPLAVAAEGGACQDHWTMKRILMAQGIGPKGRGRLVHQCTASLRKWCIVTERSGAVHLTTNEEGEERYTFDPSVVENWLLIWGTDIIDAHKTKRGAFNVARMRRASAALEKHANALEAEGRIA
jgi:hypothetical protein